jgi:hypothetical protein
MLNPNHLTGRDRSDLFWGKRPDLSGESVVQLWVPPPIPIPPTGNPLIDQLIHLAIESASVYKDVPNSCDNLCPLEHSLDIGFETGGALAATFGFPEATPFGLLVMAAVGFSEQFGPWED